MPFKPIEVEPYVARDFKPIEVTPYVAPSPTEAAPMADTPKPAAGKNKES